MNYVSIIGRNIYRMRESIDEIKEYMRKASEQGKELKELKKRVQFLEQRLDDGHQLDLARDFTWPEIKNICIKVSCISKKHNQL